MVACSFALFVHLGGPERRPQRGWKTQDESQWSLLGVSLSVCSPCHSCMAMN